MQTEYIDAVTGQITIVPWTAERIAAENASREAERRAKLDQMVITPRQCRLILMQQGLLETVKEMIAQQDEETKITWEYALEFRRNDPLLLALATNLNLSSEQIDQFFIAASQL